MKKKSTIVKEYKKLKPFKPTTIKTTVEFIDELKNCSTVTELADICKRRIDQIKGQQ